METPLVAIKLSNEIVGELLVQGSGTLDVSPFVQKLSHQSQSSAFRHIIIMNN
jgi:hypothetical protein